MRWQILIIIFFLFSFSSISQAQEADFLANYPDCGFSEQAGDDLRVGAVLINLDNRLGCIENFDTKFNVASVPKIFVAAAYYEWLAQGLISQAVSLQFTRNYWLGGRNDCLREDDIGNRYTYQELVELMINCSDNAATWMLMDSLGWGRVNAWIQDLGIEGIGEVIPYSEVDRLKLTFIDPRWANVPRDVASRFYRGRITSGLLQYFDVVPDRPSRTEFAIANQRYYEENNYNTITPRALATFILRLRDGLSGDSAEAWFTATNLFNVMLYTQRLYSVQALPGTVYIGSKNGFDRGLLAETNILFSSLEERIPSGMVLLFTQYKELDEDNSEVAFTSNSALNTLFSNFSPLIREKLFPNYLEHDVLSSFQISSITFHQQSPIQVCWNPFFNSGFDSALIPILESCFTSLTPRITYPIDENLAFGLVLRNLNFTDTRLTFIYTAPDGRRFSYQEDRQNTNNAAIYWFHPLDMAGQWQIDIYINLQRVYTQTVIAQR